MIELNKTIIIGGASRNIGKTELVCGLVRRFGSTHDVVSLKISGIKSGNELFHGNHDTPPGKFHLMEETSRDGVKDSSKMLLAGASKAYYLRTRDEFLLEAVESFFSLVDKDTVIICESITLRKIISPGLFVLVKGIKEESGKKSLEEVLHLVDLIIVSDGVKFIPDPGIIHLGDHGWYCDSIL
ncbi:MAG: hypothetical protein ACLFQA_03305 [Bacteroidales bacterium]